MSDRWGVASYNFLKPPPGLGGGLLEGFGDLHERAARNGAQHGTPVLVTVPGFTDPDMNLFFRVWPMTGRGIRTWRRHAYTLVVWLNFLRVFGRSWHDATARAEVSNFIGTFYNRRRLRQHKIFGYLTSAETRQRQQHALAA